MPTILLKKSDTPGSVPGTANLTNLAGGVEVAVNTADKRVYSMTSASAVIELGTNPSSLTCSDVSATVLRAGSATITNLTLTSLVISNLSIASANITTLTSASATITNLLGTTLTISGNSFLATSSGNLGIGTSSPATKLHVNGAARIQSDLELADSGNTVRGYIFGTSGGVTYRATSGLPHIWQNVGTELMQLTSSGNLGIGTSSPLSKLDVRAASAAIDQYQTIQAFSTDSAAIDKGAGLALGGYYSGTSSIAVFGSLVGRKENSTAGNFSGYLAFGTNNNATGTTEKMRLDSSGNLGLGVTPSAWETANSVRALQLNGGNVSSFSNAYIWVGQNWYRDSASAERYVNTAAATKYQQAFGAHSWYTAASGTAGNTISFTQAMTLDASGNLLVGGTSQNGTANRVAVFSANKFGLSVIDTTAQALGVGGALNLGGNYRTTGDAQAFCRVEAAKENSTDNNFAYAMAFSTTPNGGTFTERARITSGGDFLIGNNPTNIRSSKFVLGAAFGGGTGAEFNNTNNQSWIPIAFHTNSSLGGYISSDATSTAYNTSSDYRLKDNPQPLTGSGAFIDGLKPKTWTWKVNGEKGVGFIAHEVQEISPSTVRGEKDGEQMQAMEYGSAEFIANIVAELQSLRARVAQLESK